MKFLKAAVWFSWAGRPRLFWKKSGYAEPLPEASVSVKDESVTTKKDQPPFPFIPDRPISSIEEDASEFGFGLQVENLTQALTQQGGSFRLGIMGPWGSGKSSFCQMMKKQLEDTDAAPKKRMVIWFDASQYQQDEKPLLPLIATIFEALDQAQGKKMSQSLATSLENVADAFGALLRAMKFRTDLNMGLLKAGVELDPKKALDHAATAQVARVRDDAETLNNEISQYDSLSPWIKRLKEALGEIGREEFQLFIFIDDLDRCPWRKALTLLEQVKVILDLPRCVFIFALNKKIIFQFIKESFSDKGLQAGFTPQQYFEKIVDLSVDVPRPSQKMKAFAKDLMETRGTWIDKKLGDNLAETLSIASHGNPRTLIKMLNQYLGRLVVQSPVLTNSEKERLLLEVCLEVLIPELHFELKHHRLSRDYLQSLMTGSAHDMVRLNDFLSDFEVADKLDAVRQLLLDPNFERWITFLNDEDSRDGAVDSQRGLEGPLKDDEGFGEVRLNRPRFLQLRNLQTQKAQRQVLELLDLYLLRLGKIHWQDNGRNVLEVLGLLNSFHSYQSIESFCHEFLMRLTQGFVTSGTDSSVESKFKQLPFREADAREIPQMCRALCEKVRSGLNDRKLSIRFRKIELEMDNLLKGDPEELLPVLFQHELFFDQLAVHDEIRTTGEFFHYALTLHIAFDRWIQEKRYVIGSLVNERVIESNSRLHTFVLGRGREDTELGQLFLSGSKVLPHSKNSAPKQDGEQTIDLSLGPQKPD